MAKRTSLHGMWSSRFAFILAVAGSAVGLGNIWKFPYMAGQNGGGAFVLFYLACVVAIGLPIMISEIMIGRRGRRNPIATMRIVGEEEGSRPSWGLVGVMGIFAGFLILSFYSVIAGWALAYFVFSLGGKFNAATPESIGSLFGGLLGNWKAMAVWHTIFMALTIAIVARGVERGLERFVRVAMPGLLLLLIILLVYAIVAADFARGWVFLLQPNFAALTRQAMLEAMGQAFFTLSVGMGAIMAYGAYLPEGTSILRTSIWVVVADTSIALLAGLIIFPIVFANGLDPASGPGLIFETLPLAFGGMPGGTMLAPIFFGLLVFAAWTSAIGLLEPAVAWSVESHGRSRRSAAMVIGLIIWGLGFLTIFSFNLMSDFRFLGGTIFDNIDHLASNVLLPLGGLFITIFAGWVMCKNSSSEELDIGTGPAYGIWRFLARWLAPAAVLVVFLHATGLLDRLGLI
ncbi:MAG: transporter [Gammaproteobacteria bacterium SG8_31]|jgi:NSS family neurotransmitter:Na+ symporter|nr:MAG: transporter [Gammaproteobacteria bacterium SG8_31]